MPNLKISASEVAGRSQLVERQLIMRCAGLKAAGAQDKMSPNRAVKFVDALVAPQLPEVFQVQRTQSVVIFEMNDKFSDAQDLPAATLLQPVVHTPQRIVWDWFIRSLRLNLKAALPLDTLNSQAISC